jgi:hypothetical protein
MRPADRPEDPRRPDMSPLVEMLAGALDACGACDRGNHLVPRADGPAHRPSPGQHLRRASRTARTYSHTESRVHPESRVADSVRHGQMASWLPAAAPNRRRLPGIMRIAVSDADELSGCHLSVRDDLDMRSPQPGVRRPEISIARAGTCRPEPVSWRAVRLASRADLNGTHIDNNFIFTPFSHAHLEMAEPPLSCSGSAALAAWIMLFHSAKVPVLRFMPASDIRPARRRTQGRAAGRIPGS